MWLGQSLFFLKNDWFGRKLMNTGRDSIILYSRCICCNVVCRIYYDEPPGRPSNMCHQLLLSGGTQYQSTLSSYLVSSWSKSISISGGDSSCSWVLVRALGLIVKEQFKSVMLGGGWRCGELLVSSSTFTVIQRIRKSVPPQKHPHWKNTNTQLQYSLYCYSLDWW